MSKDGEPEVRGDEPPPKRARTEEETDLSNPDQLTQQQQYFDDLQGFKERGNLHTTVKQALDRRLDLGKLRWECGLEKSDIGGYFVRSEGEFIKRNEEGNTPLMVALKSIDRNPEVAVKVVNILLQHHAYHMQLTIPDKSGKYPHQIVESMRRPGEQISFEMNECLKSSVSRIFDGFPDMLSIMRLDTQVHRKTLTNLCNQLQYLLDQCPELLKRYSVIVQIKIDGILEKYLTVLNKATDIMAKGSKKTPDQSAASAKLVTITKGCEQAKAAGKGQDVLISVKAFLRFFEAMIENSSVEAGQSRRGDAGAAAVDPEMPSSLGGFPATFDSGGAAASAAGKALSTLEAVVQFFGAGTSDNLAMTSTLLQEAYYGSGSGQELLK